MTDIHNNPEQIEKQEQIIGGSEIFSSSSSENMLRSSDSDFDSENGIKSVESKENQQKENSKEFSKKNEIVKKFKSAYGEENYDLVLDILSDPNNMKEIFNSYDDYDKKEFINFLFEYSEKGKTEEINKKVSENILLEIFKPGKMKEFLESPNIDKEELIDFLIKISKYENLNKKAKNNIREIFNFIKEKSDIVLFEKLSKKIVNSGLFNITADEVEGNYNELSGEYKKFVNSLDDFMKKNKEISENKEKNKGKIIFIREKDKNLEEEELKKIMLTALEHIDKVIEFSSIEETKDFLIDPLNSEKEINDYSTKVLKNKNILHDILPTLEYAREREDARLFDKALNLFGKVLDNKIEQLKEELINKTIGKDLQDSDLKNISEDHNKKIEYFLNIKEQLDSVSENYKEAKDNDLKNKEEKEKLTIQQQSAIRESTVKNLTLEAISEAIESLNKVVNKDIDISK